MVIRLVEGGGEVKINILDDDLKAKAKEVVSILRNGAIRAGTLDATKAIEPSPADFGKVADQIVFVEYDLYTGDERSCGTLECTWNTPLGVLVYSRVFDTVGDIQEDSWKLDGSLLVDNQEAWEEIVRDLDLQPPHYYNGKNTESKWDFDGSVLSVLLSETT